MECFNLVTDTNQYRCCWECHLAKPRGLCVLISLFRANEKALKFGIQGLNKVCNYSVRSRMSGLKFLPVFIKSPKYLFRGLLELLSGCPCLQTVNHMRSCLENCAGDRWDKSNAMKRPYVVASDLRMRRRATNPITPRPTNNIA